MNECIKDFPQLHTDHPLTYLDTAASSLTPEPVLHAMDQYYRGFRANTHRGLYETAEKATEAYERARQVVANFIGAYPQELVFTASATIASNMLMYALEGSLELHEGDEIVVSVAEHHAALVPLQQLAKRKGLVIRTVPLSEDHQLDFEVLQSFLNNKTRLVSIMFASNVLGSIFDVSRAAQIAHEHGAIVVCDMTAAAGHTPINVKDLDVDYAFFSAHKMCGPTGVGVLYGKEEYLHTLQPGFFGGHMIDTVGNASATFAEGVARFEPGTAPIAEVIGLAAAVEYLETHSLQRINAHSSSVCERAYHALGQMPGVRVIGESDVQKNIGILSFVIDRVHPHDVAQVLAQESIAIRSGHHCSMPLMSFLSVPATSRVSFYLYNTHEDVNDLIRGIERVQNIFS